MSLTNLRTTRSLEAQFNPTEIGAKLDAAYTDLAILGLSHKPQQYGSTSNVEIPIELFFDRMESRGGGDGFDVARRYLLSLLYPSKGDTVSSGGTDDVLFVWPRLYSLACRVRSWEEKHHRFARDGGSTLMTVKLVLHQISAFRILAEDIEESGLEAVRDS